MYRNPSFAELSPVNRFMKTRHLRRIVSGWNRVLAAVVVLCWGCLCPELAHCQEAAEPKPYCGADCLYIGLRSLDVDVPTYEEFISQMGQPPVSGFSMDDLKVQAARFQATATNVITSPANLSARTERFACIAWLKRGHFVLLADVDPAMKEVHMVDYPAEATISFAGLGTQWSGEALLISRNPVEPEEVVAQRVAAGGSQSSTWFVVYVAIAIAIVVLVGILVRKVRRS